MTMRLRKQLSIFLAFVFFLTVSVQAADKFKIHGTVSDELGDPILGASVIIKGTKLGTSTDIDGKFALDASVGDILQVTYVGYEKLDIPVTDKRDYKITMIETSQVMDEVVVTALGLKRSQKALGYSVQEVKGDELNVARGAEMVTSLTGKIAGLQINNSTEFAGGASIKLRGMNPLLVLDGVPHYNLEISDIPSEDIESISVLKGSTASALYGSRGGGGAIMITTKKANKEGIDVTVASSTMFHAGFLKIPTPQTSYSAGGAGKYGTDDYVWGDKLDIGRTALQYNPKTYEWEEMPLVSKGKDNLKNFLEPALVTNNNVSISQKGQYGSFRTSLNHVYNKGQYPNQDQQKLSFIAGGTMDYQRLHLNAGMQYNKNMYSSANGQGYGQGGFLYDILIWTGADYDIRDYRDYWIAGKEHQEQNWNCGWWYNNPYFTAYERTASRQWDSTNGHLDVTVDVTDWLKATLRLGGDYYYTKRKNKTPISTRGNMKGAYSQSTNNGFSTTDDFMLVADKKLGDFEVDGFVGGSIFYRENETYSASTVNGLNLPGYYSLKASNDPINASTSQTRQQVNSVYGRFGASWRSMIFLEVTGRNDWTSTLSKDKRSYFYPSFSGSFVPTEALKFPDVINFWKIRGSWTRTKTPAGVYDINSVYSISRNYWGNMTAAFFPSSMRDINLEPETLDAFEIGTELFMLNNRLRFDFAFYRNHKYNLQRSVSLSQASGFSSSLVNYDEEQLRKGFEISVRGDIIQTKDFSWTSTVNWSSDRYYYYKVDEMYSTQKPYVAPGKTWDWLDMYDWEYAPDGQLILYNGMPKESNYPKYAGRETPDFIWGWSNSFRYKDFTLNFSFDGRVGGLQFDYMSSRMWHAGVHPDSDNKWRYDEVVNGNHKGYIAEGVKIVSGSVKYDSDGNILEDTRVFAPNDVAVSYESFARSYYGSSSKSIFKRDMTFFKLRELSIAYRLPKKYCVGIIKGAEAALVGQNLLLWSKGFRFSDPDRGSENINSPSVRLIGFNVKLNF